MGSRLPARLQGAGGFQAEVPAGPADGSDGDGDAEGPGRRHCAAPDPKLPSLQIQAGQGRGAITLVLTRLHIS